MTTTATGDSTQKPSNQRFVEFESGNEAKCAIETYMGHFPQDGENEQNLSEFFF